MIEIRCKNCGGLNRIESFYGEIECEYCYGLMELGDGYEKFQNLYRKADDAWSRQDFDAALAIYEQIVDEDATQAEAHWSAALCRYGVSYVKDPYRGNKIPTCNRINRVSILEDKNYLAAIKYASPNTREQYELRAREIDRISQEFLKIVDQEEPYDVFISYKNRDENDRRTLDAQIAKKLYLYLKEKGFKVFFAEETLKAKAGSMFEPYIFAALTSAKVMVLFSSSMENVEATWVKNEWKRYLKLAQEDPHKTLIPAYIGDFYKVMPMELGSIQGFDAQSPVFNEEIGEFVKIKLGEAKKKQEPKKGVDLAERYASEDKINKLVDELDCERELAVSALVLFQGNTTKASAYICDDGEYKRKRWECSECRAVNTHDTCHKCGVSKKQSAELARMREEMERKRKKKSAAHKQAVAEKSKKTVKILVILAIIAAVLAGLFFLLRYAAFMDQETMIAVCVGTGLVLAIIITIVVRVTTGDGGCGMFIILYIGIALVLTLIGFGARFLFIREVDDLYTPEIVQTYSYINGDNSIIVTITECTQDGQVTAIWSEVEESGYWRAELKGQITSKKNNGDITITWNSENLQMAPSGGTWNNEGTAKITKKYTKYEGLNDTLTAGGDDKNAISSVQDLEKLRGSSETFTLKNDIDLSGAKWSPIQGFTGMLIGNGFTIKNMTIASDSSDVGFFGVLEGTVMNLNFENASVTVEGRNEDIGILCGELAGRAMNVSVSGNVTADKSAGVGGVAGFVSTTGNIAISNIQSSATVQGLNYVGGLFGQINDSVSNGSTEYVMVLSNLENSGTATAIEDFAGGICGSIYGEATGFGGSMTTTVVDCTNTGTITGRYYVGGIVGYGDCDTASTIDNCTNASAINAEANAGCIAGVLGRFCISESSNEGSTMNATGAFLEEGRKYAYVGGLVGRGICLTDCTNYIDIQYNGGGDYVGGLMGYCTFGASIVRESAFEDGEAYYKNLKNLGNITGNSYVGGIMGGMDYFWDNGCTAVTATFEKLSNTGAINGTGNNIGGIGGYMAGGVGGIGGKLMWYFYDSQNEGAVTGNANVGGLFGGFKNSESKSGGYVQNTVTIDNCTSTGTISAKANFSQTIGLDEIKR